MSSYTRYILGYRVLQSLQTFVYDPANLIENLLICHRYISYINSEETDANEKQPSFQQRKPFWIFSAISQTPSVTEESLTQV